MFSPAATVLDLFILSISFYAFSYIRNRRRRGGLRYPPGPDALPVIGNLLDLPKEHSWLAYTEMGKKYGNMISFSVFGKMIVVLNSAQVAKDLLEKRGGVYSDRPRVPFYEMMDWDLNLPITHYGEDWRLARKLVDRGLRPGAVTKYRSMQQARVRVLLSRVLERPDELENYVDRMQGELSLAMTYGYEVKGPNDERVALAQEIHHIGIERTLPGALLVNELPFLRHIPGWLSWISYKPLARVGRDLWVEAVRSPMQFVKDTIADGTARPSLALENLEQLQDLSMSERKKAEHVLMYSLASMYSAAADTTGSATMVFILAALLHPDVQKKAQAEIDAVTGLERLPTFDDRTLLPYTDAICKEVLRWRPVTPLAVPHSSIKDDVYEGFFIPEGAVVISNTWAILHDPELYPEPDRFRPERFLEPDGSVRDDPMLTMAFGLGKRICPGRHFADATLFITVASILSAFKISKKKDADGNEIPFEPTFTNGVIRYSSPMSVQSGRQAYLTHDSRPSPFPFSVVPRDKKAADLIAADVLAR
ncbi:cytochrome P450 [Gloeopeniophorella convolvens]|nr:cytochrome P450 [Gloeopeniophorella convolvens]